MYEIIEFFSKNDTVKKFVVFGSSVSDACYVGSDADIYVKLINPEKNIIKDKSFNFVYNLWTNYTVDEKLYSEIIIRGL